MKKNKIKKQIIESAIMLFIGIISFFLWDTFLIYPIKLFVVLTHELSHAVAAIATGGVVHSIEITGSLGGTTSISNGNNFIVAFAGYLGSLGFGSLLFYSGYDLKLARWVCFSFAGLFIITAANLLVGDLGIILAIVFSILLIVSPVYFPKSVHNYFMKILGIISCLYALIDIKEDLITLEYRPSDAQLLANITSIPAYIWGILWFGVSCVTIFLLLRYSFRKGY